MQLDSSDQKRRVAAGYDRVSYAYRSDDFDYAGSDYARVLGLVLPEIGARDFVVELGCGCGIPVSQVLAPRCRLTGIDISAVQLARASGLVPRASFVRADMASLHLRRESLKAVVAFWSLIHVPLEEQPGLLARIHDWLRPGGLFLGTVGYQEWVGTEDDWCGVPGATMYWSHAGRETYLRWFADAGLQVEREDFIREGDGGATVLLARRPD